MIDTLFPFITEELSSSQTILAFLTRLLAPEFHIVRILPPLAVPLPCPALALGVLVHAGLGCASLACLHSQD